MAQPATDLPRRRILVSEANPVTREAIQGLQEILLLHTRPGRPSAALVPYDLLLAWQAQLARENDALRAAVA